MTSLITRLAAGGAAVLAAAALTACGSVSTRSSVPPTTPAAHMSGMMQRWHQVLPSPYQPGAGMIPGTGRGMMSSHDWADMQHWYGHEFNDHWLDAMMANRSAELAPCRNELQAGPAPRPGTWPRPCSPNGRLSSPSSSAGTHTIGHYGDHAVHSGQ